MPGIIGALAIYAALFGACWLFGNGNDETVASSADPVLLMLGGTDPTKDAGLVGRERGPARGTSDGSLRERLKAAREENNRAAAEEARIAQEKAAQEKAARERAAAAKKTPPSAQKSNAKKNVAGASGKTAPGKSASAEKVNIRKELAKNSAGKGNGAAGKSSSGKNSKSGARVGEVSVGGNGKTFGSPDGTGDNGGDGGSRVADARQLYVEAVLKRFKIHFDDVVRDRISISSRVTVDVRFTVDARGNVKFRDVVGNSDPQIRAALENVFRRAFPTPFQRPPNGTGFVGKLEDISFDVR